MNLFIFTNVLWDYSDGMVVVAATSLEDAQALVFEHFDVEDTDYYLKKNPGFVDPAGVYPLLTDEKRGVMHVVFGGA